MASEDEALVGCLFYFEADGYPELEVLELSGLSANGAAAGDNKSLGSGKNGKGFVQPTPTKPNYTTITVQIVATENKELYEWFEECNPVSGGESQWAQKLGTASVVVYDQARNEQARWDIFDCYPNQYESSDAEANSTELATETVTIIHRGFERVN